MTAQTPDDMKLFPHLLIIVPGAHRRAVDATDQLAGPFVDISQSLGNAGELILSPCVHVTSIPQQSEFRG